ncbi:flagellin [Oryzifoliimicrobium ureilyticus]|uniref:flagellin N-terminal helical domain-containing protein n=1 Tax=Oryzifoliimicrobium ureilyticus TaxID=3113724 RepID=UPI0030761244
MSYRITNSGLVSALALATSINKDYAKVQQQFSSGLTIATAADNASQWSFATVMRNDSASLKSIHDALGVGTSKTDTAYTAMQGMIDVLGNIRATLTSAKEAGVDKDQLNTTLSGLKSQLQTSVNSANFAGENWLFNDQTTLPANRTMIGGFTRDAAGNYTPQTIDYPAGDTVMIDTSDPQRGLFTKSVDVAAASGDTSGVARNYYLLNGGGTPDATAQEIKLDKTTTSGQVDDMISAVSALLSQLTTSAAGLGNLSKRLDDRSDLLSNLGTTLDTTVGNLVDTNMEEAAARQKAMDTQQAMASEALSILNTVSSKVLLLLQ